MAKLTPTIIKKMIAEEAEKLESTEERAKETKEVDADEFADTLEKQIDYVKVLKLEETRLTKRLMLVKEAKQKILKRISDKIHT